MRKNFYIIVKGTDAEMRSVVLERGCSILKTFRNPGANRVSYDVSVTPHGETELFSWFCENQSTLIDYVEEDFSFSDSRFLG